MQATNHGIDASLMEDLMEASREFFHQPLQERQKYSNLREGTRFQLEGYGSDPVVAQDHILDWNDRLQLKVEPEDERSLAQWPEHPESFRSPTLLSVLAFLEPEYWKYFFTEPFNTPNCLS